MGFRWAKKRIVIYDNLITHLSPEEILAIVGHEIGMSVVVFTEFFLLGHYKFHREYLAYFY